MEKTELLPFLEGSKYIFVVDNVESKKGLATLISM